MSNLVRRTVDVLDCYEGRDAAITLTLYLCCLLSGFYPRKSNLHRSLRRIFKRLEDCRVVLRLYDDLTILRDLFTYELRPGVRSLHNQMIIFFLNLIFKERNWIVRCLKCLHYLSWLAYYPSEHITWLGEMKMLDIDQKLWDFFTNFFWSTALLTSALWYRNFIFEHIHLKYS
jgi:hypothetical protein